MDLEQKPERSSQPDESSYHGPEYVRYFISGDDKHRRHTHSHTMQCHYFICWNIESDQNCVGDMDSRKWDIQCLQFVHNP